MLATLGAAASQTVLLAPSLHLVASWHQVSICSGTNWDLCCWHQVCTSSLAALMLCRLGAGWQQVSICSGTN